MARYWLTIIQGPQKGTEIDLTDEQIVVGRHPDSDININDPEVSRNHFTFRKRGEEYWLEDLGSTNGTVVNGRPTAKPYRLRNNTRINLGANVVLVFHKELPKPVEIETLPNTIERIIEEEPQSVIRRTRKEEPVFEEKRKRKSFWLEWGCFGLLLILLAVAVAALYYIDTNFLWCDLIGQWWLGCY